MFDQLIAVYKSAAMFLVIFMVSLGVTAALAKYIPLLAGSVGILTLARVVWSRTSRY